MKSLVYRDSAFSFEIFSPTTIGKGLLNISKLLSGREGITGKAYSKGFKIEVRVVLDDK